MGKRKNALIDRSQGPQSLMPPSPENIIRCCILLLIMFSLFFTFIERMLYPDIGLYFPFCCFQPYQSCHAEGIPDLDLSHPD